MVDAYIHINPPVDTNPVSATHTFTARVFVNDGGGAGYVAAPNGTAVTFAYVGGHVGDFKPDVPAGTNPNPCLTVGGSCGIDTTSTSAGNDTMRASASLSRVRHPVQPDHRDRQARPRQQRRRDQALGRRFRSGPTSTTPPTT